MARGVQLVTRTGSGNKPKRKTVQTRKEIILCAGPFGSPHVLMLSGIGPADHLKEHNIDIVKDLPAVGSNLVCPRNNLFSKTEMCILITIIARPLWCSSVISR